MTLEIDQAGATFVNSERLSGTPAVRVTGEGVRLTNSESGRILADNDRTAAVQLDASGVTVVNEAGGIIRSSSFLGSAIRGSEGSDVIDSAGLIVGIVDLGSGADTFIQRGTDPQAIFEVSVALGEGDDIYRALGNLQTFSPEIAAGTGIDRLRLEGTIGVAYGNRITGFEQLELNAGVTNVSGFSGFTSITLTAAGTGQFTAYNFVDSLNPAVDLALPGGFLGLNSSSVRSITGSDGPDTLFLGGSTVVSGPTNLGMGNDMLDLYLTRSVEQPRLLRGIDGGAGYDMVSIAAEGIQTVDLATMTNFETLSVYGIVTSDSSAPDVRLSNFAGIGYIAGPTGGGRLTLTGGSAASVNVVAGALGSLVIDDGTTIARYGFLPPLGFPASDLTNVIQGDDRASVTVTNRGRINGDVELGIGDDLFDTASGTIGGTIYGYAGNDVIRGSAARDIVFGGFGADWIEGAGGSDQIDGGGGADRLFGGIGSDVLLGGSENDTIDGQEDGDFLLGGSGDDRMFGSAGVDLLGGEAGNDELHGGLDGDNLYGGAGSDLIFGEDGNDTIDGQEDGDFILGGAGDDRLFGGAGVDLLGGEVGNDELHGGFGNDSLYGGTGTDSIFGEDGDDVIDGQEDGDFILGGAGNDRLLGSGGVDLLGGEDGDDLLFGGAEGDNMYGGDGADALFGEDGNDFVSGGSGSDILGGNGGSDRIEGGAGIDTFLYFSTLDSSTTGGGADVISDFLSGTDKIDLSGIDADTSIAGDQAFIFVGISDQAGPAGTLRVGFIQDVGIFLFGNVNDDPAADFILNIGTFNVQTTDFFL